MAYKYTPFKVSNSTNNLGQKMNNDTETLRRFYNQGYSQGAGGYGSQLKTSQARLDSLYNNNNLSQQFNYSRQGEYNKALDNVANREAFKYDLAQDQLFQQAKEQYQQMGRTAMVDTAGQAAAMTGGYGNSYATTAAAQAYNAHIQQLNNSIGDYYSMALNTYNTESNRLQGVLNAFQSDRANEQNEWKGNWDVYNTLYNTYSNDLNNLRSLDQQAWGTKGQGLNNIADISTTQYNNAYKNESDIWGTGEGLKATQAQQRETERANRAEENYKNRSLEETIRANKTDENYKNRSLPETIRANKVSESKSKKTSKTLTKQQSAKTADKLFKTIIKATNKATNGVARPSNQYSNRKDGIAEKYITEAQKNGTLSASDAKKLYQRLGLL